MEEFPLVKAEIQINWEPVLVMSTFSVGESGASDITDSECAGKKVVTKCKENPYLCPWENLFMLFVLVMGEKIWYWMKWFCYSWETNIIDSNLVSNTR